MNGNYGDEIESGRLGYDKQRYLPLASSCNVGVVSPNVEAYEFIFIPAICIHIYYAMCKAFLGYR